ncbi:CAP domain-containing protein [uncultured Cetobacterium sp.]|uniref:CAP domain-containing protein n=1 Tax=uncultured Cetobacterium sp. TaxID=527638 RepID=UPI0026279539|nr:CAP domain-containing protein [uncultured Cetobacterium sp.]
MKKFVSLVFFIVSIVSFSFSKDQIQILKLVNKERVTRGLTPLKLNKVLNQLANIKSNDMYKNNYFSHNSLVYGSPFDLMKQYNVKYMTAAENIAKGQDTPDYVMKMWMKSKGHKKNILNPRFKEMGVSRDNFNNNIWTQMFIGD